MTRLFSEIGSVFKQRSAEEFLDKVFKHLWTQQLHRLRPVDMALFLHSSVVYLLNNMPRLTKASKSNKGVQKF